MGYKQPSSGLPFKEIGSSPAKQEESTSGDKINKMPMFEVPEVEGVEVDENPSLQEPEHKKSTVRKVVEFLTGTSKSGRKVKAALHGGEENLLKKEEIGDARRARHERKKEAKHANKLARLNKPTRAERRKSKRENTKEE